MSDKITKTVVFEIEPGGDCDKCESRSDSRCMAFNEFIFVHKYKEGSGVMGMVFNGTENKQCQACRDYLSEQKSRVYCDGCDHFSYGFDDSKCEKEKEIKFDNSFEPEDWYCKKCTDRSE